MEIDGTAYKIMSQQQQKKKKKLLFHFWYKR